MGSLRDKILQARDLPDEAYINFIYDLIKDMYVKGMNKSMNTYKKIHSFREMRNQKHKDEFYAEMRKLKNSPYIKDDHLRQIKKMMPKHVEQLITTFGITLKDIAEYTVEDVNDKINAWSDLRRLVKVLSEDESVPTVQDKIDNQNYNVYVSKKPQSYKEQRNYHFLYHKEIDLEKAKDIFINHLEPNVKKLFTPSGVCYIKDKK